MIVFHRVLISTAILFCFGMAVWSAASYSSGGNGGSVALGASFAAAGLLLAYYLKNLKRFLRK